MVFLPFFKLKDFPVPEICVFEEGRYFMPIPKSIIPLTPFALPKWNPVIIYDLIQSVLQILTPDLISFKKVGSDQHAETCRCGSNLLLDTEHRNQGKGFESRPSDSLLLHLCDRSHLISGKQEVVRVYVQENLLIFHHVTEATGPADSCGERTEWSYWISRHPRLGSSGREGAHTSVEDPPTLVLERESG